MNKPLSQKYGLYKAFVSILSSPLFKRSLFFLAIFHLFAFFSYSLPTRLQRTDGERDLIANYQAMERTHNNASLYLTSVINGSKRLETLVYNYPPPLSSILGMLPAMSLARFSKIWTLVLCAAFWIYAICLTKIAIGRISLSGTLIAGLALTLFPGTHVALSSGQIDPILWALFGMALAIPKLKGACLMSITLVKPWALWPLLWAIKDRWKVVNGALIVALGSLVLGGFVRGVEVFYSEWLTWLRDVLPFLGQGSWATGNWSISFGVLRVLKQLGFWKYPDGVLPGWAQLWLFFCGIFVPILSGIFLRKRRMIIQLSIIGCIAIVFSPICWISYLPILLTPICLFLRLEDPATADSMPGQG